jgi:hypothetical protein
MHRQIIREPLLNAVKFRSNSYHLTQTRRFVASGIIVAILVLGSGAYAQTTEDAVAFILFGVESGATSSGFSGKRWKDSGPGNLSLDLSGESDDDDKERKIPLHFVVRKVSNCTYTVVISASKQVRDHHLEGRMLLITADFGRIFSIRYQDLLGLRVAGLPKAICEYVTEHNNPADKGRKTKCMREPYEDLSKSEREQQISSKSDDNEQEFPFPTMEMAKPLVATAIDSEKLDAAISFVTKTCAMLKF